MKAIIETERGDKNESCNKNTTEKECEKVEYVTHLSIILFFES